MMNVPNHNRVTKGKFATEPAAGNNGVFIIPIRKGKFIYYAKCIASDVGEWEHVSVSLLDNKGKPILRTPTWEEMCEIKNIFWDKNDEVIQIHPPEKEYVNIHPHCLHLWRSTAMEQSLPPKIFV